MVDIQPLCSLSVCLQLLKPVFQQSYLQAMHNSILLRNASSEKSSKSKLDLLLPRIAKAEASPSPIQTLSDSSFGSLALRFHWLTIPRDYSSVSFSQIEAEYTQLRKELLALNEQAARNVERLALKTKPGRIESSHLIEVRSKEAENNAAIIGRLRAQLQQLQKRATVVGEISKDELDDSIRQAKEEIIALRHKNKELQQKSKEIGSSIEAGDDAFSELKKIEVQLSLAERRRNKLELRWKETAANMEKVEIGLQSLSGEAEQAQSYIQQQLESSRVDQAQKRMQSLFRHRSYNLQTLRKNEDSFSTLKQQKYHQYLKQLQEIITRIDAAQAATLKATQKNLQQKQELTLLQNILRERLEASNRQIESAEGEGEQKENQQKVDEVFKYTATVPRHLKPKPIQNQTQSNSQYERMSQQQPTKTKLLNLRINKSVNQKKDKSANMTIDVPTQHTATLKKKGNNWKIQRLNATHMNTNKPTPARMNTVAAQITQHPPFSAKTQQKNNNQLEYAQEELIEQQIQQSPLKEEGAEQNRQQNTINKHSPSLPSIQNQTRNKNSSEQNSEEEQDEDLADFKKSIAAQLNGPFSGVGSIEIALGEIEYSIRQHQSKLQKTKDNPIEQEQEPFQQPQP